MNLEELNRVVQNKPTKPVLIFRPCKEQFNKRFIKF